MRHEDIGITVADLKVRALININVDGVNDYIKESRKQQDLKRFLLERGQMIRQGDYGSLTAVFSRIGIHTHLQNIEKLLPHISVLSRYAFDLAGFTVPAIAKKTLSWWGKYTALAVPAYENVDIVGLWLITLKGSNYLPLTERECSSAGFGLVPLTSDEAVFVLNDIEAAVRLSIWSIIDKGTTTGFVVPYGLKDRAEYYKSKRVIFWTPEETSQWYFRALDTPAALTLSHDKVSFSTTEELPFDGSFSTFLRYATQSSVAAHEAAAQYLITKPIHEAKAVLNGIVLETSHRAKILAYAQGQDADHISQLFEETIHAQVATWNGSTITECEGGWVCNGKIISSAIIHLDRIQPQGPHGEARLFGSVIHARRSYPFQCSLSDLRRNPGDWITRLLVAKAGIIPYIEKSWSYKLLEVAQQFHVPSPMLKDLFYGWLDNKLRMPMFVIDKKGVYAAQSTITGPAITLPAPLTDAELDSFKNTSFCRLYLALLGNFIRTYKERNAIGIMLVNSQHVIVRLAAAFGDAVKASPTVEEIDDNAKQPLPIFTEWTQTLLRNAFKGSPVKNILLSVDSTTDILCRVCSDWLHIRIDQPLDYGAFRHLFLVLPALLSKPLTDCDDKAFYRQLASGVKLEIESVEKTRLDAAATDLDFYYIQQAQHRATKIIEMLLYLTQKDLLHPTINDEYVTVKYHDLAQSVADFPVILPQTKDMTDALLAARFLVGKSAIQWQISRSVWDLTTSLFTTATST